MNLMMQFLIRLIMFTTILVISACEPNLDSSDPDERALAVKAVSDQPKLAELLIKEDNIIVQGIALNKIKDQMLLSKIALNADLSE